MQAVDAGVSECGLGVPPLRLEIAAVAKVLRMSRAQVYNRIQSGALRVQKDGARTFVRWSELERYVAACDGAEVGGGR